MDAKKPEIYFHVGLGKVASSWLQYKVFDKFKGIHYIHRDRFRTWKRVLEENKYPKYLLSQEHDRQFERELSKFAELYPQTKTIIILRRHDSWIASQYRRYVKNGSHRPFTDFFDVENNEGRWDREVLYFYKKIKFLETHFDHKPLVLFHDELKEGGYSFLDRIAHYVGATYDRSRISLSASHTSYSEKQLLLLYEVSQKLFSRDRKQIEQPVLRWIEYRKRWLICHVILYMSFLFPDPRKKGKKLIPDEEFQKVRAFYEEDWQQCLDYAKANNPL